MTTTHADPIQYAVFNAAGEVVEFAETQVAAFRLIDWLVIHEPAAGPYRAALTLAAA